MMVKFPKLFRIFFLLNTISMKIRRCLYKIICSWVSKWPKKSNFMSKICWLLRAAFFLLCLLSLPWCCREVRTRNLINVSAAEEHVDAFLNAIEELFYRAVTVKTIPEQPWGKMEFRRISVKNYYIYFKIYADAIQNRSEWVPVRERKRMRSSSSTR